MENFHVITTWISYFNVEQIEACKIEFEFTRVEKMSGKKPDCFLFDHHLILLCSKFFEINSMYQTLLD